MTYIDTWHRVFDESRLVVRRGPTRLPARAETTGRETTTGDRSIGIRFTRARDSVGGGLGR